MQRLITMLKAFLARLRPASPPVPAASADRVRNLGAGARAKPAPARRGLAKAAAGQLRQDGWEVERLDPALQPNATFLARKGKILVVGLTCEADATLDTDRLIALNAAKAGLNAHYALVIAAAEPSAVVQELARRARIFLLPPAAIPDVTLIVRRDLERRRARQAAGQGVAQ